jgi:DNA invertase Pin-like site-specific DNA recombinase
VKIVGYVRVSTEKQANNGLSLEAQEEKIRLYAQLHDLDLVEVIVEDVSARSLDRPGLQEALNRLINGQAQGIIVAKLDRLTRSVRDLGELLDEYFTRGSLALMSVGESIDTTTAAGRLVLNVLVSVAQWERETASERTKEVLAHQKAQGKRTGVIPYGKRLSGEGQYLEDDPYEQSVMRLVKKYRAQGKTERAIVDLLAKRGKVGRTGKAFQKTQIHNILKAVEIGEARNW